MDSKVDKVRSRSAALAMLWVPSFFAVIPLVWQTPAIYFRRQLGYRLTSWNSADGGITC